MKCRLVVVFAALVLAWPVRPVNAEMILAGFVTDTRHVPIGGAAIVFHDRAGGDAGAESDRRGRFIIRTDANAGTLTAEAMGFTPRTISVVPGGGPIEITLARADRGVIGRTETAVTPPAATKRAAPQAQFSAAEAIGRAAFRAGDVLATLPGVSAVGQGSSDSTDLFLSVRGFRPSETLTLLDGQPIGPIGVLPDMAAGFNYQDSPLFALQRTTLTYGAGPSTDFAYDGLSGIVNLQTLAPTGTPLTQFIQSTGGDRRSSSALRATGTLGAIGYALAYGVQGTSGNFTPQTIAQTGLRSSDFTSATLAALTYPVSANAVLRNGLFKLRAPLGSSTTATLTGVGATSWVDKTGADDNDYYPYAFELYQAQHNLGGSLVPGGASCTKTLVPVSDDAHPDAMHPDCITPSAFAANASGPAGGGPGAYQTLQRYDAHLGVVTTSKAHTIALDLFTANETQRLTRPASFVQGPATGNATQTVTGGFSARDNVAVGSATIGLGLSSVRQRVASTGDIGAGASTIAQGNAFLSASTAQSRRIAASVSVLAKRFPPLATAAIDSHVALLYRPAASDVLQLAGGVATGAPAALALGGSSTLTAAGDLDPGNCSTFTIGSTPNAALATERASDLELSYGHHFGARAEVGATAYATSSRGQIFGASTPLAAIAGFSAASPALAGFYDRVRSICPGSYSGATDAQIFNALTLEQPLNAARALARGVEFTGSVRLTSTLRAGATYTIDSTRRFDLPAAVLAIPSNFTTVDGGQVAGVPIHQASATLAFATPAGFTATLDAHYQGPNNHYNLPGFAYGDLTIGALAGHGLRFDLAVQNVFDSHADVYGRVGLGLFQPENQFGTDTNALEQATERYGLLPRTIILTATLRVGGPG